eukprot:4364040-Pyramimonas_sp.AAC.1
MIAGAAIPRPWIQPPSYHDPNPDDEAAGESARRQRAPQHTHTLTENVMARARLHETNKRKAWRKRWITHDLPRDIGAGMQLQRN